MPFCPRSRAKSALPTRTFLPRPGPVHYTEKFSSVKISPERGGVLRLRPGFGCEGRLTVASPQQFPALVRGIAEQEMACGQKHGRICLRQTAILASFGAVSLPPENFFGEIFRRASGDSGGSRVAGGGL